MKEFGKENQDKLLFLPGAFSDFSWYMPSLELLSKRWHVLLVIYDGYHPPYDTSFTSVEDAAMQVIAYCKGKGLDTFDLVYGLSMGGTIASLIYAHDSIEMHTLIIDAGMSPHHLPRPLSKLVLWKEMLGLKMMLRSKRLMKIAFPPERWLYPWEDESAYDESLAFMNHLSDETIKNCFYSCNNFRMPENLPQNDTKIHYWYGELESRGRAPNVRYYQEKYPQIMVRKFSDRDHGELATIGYKEFIQAMEEVC